MSPRDPIVELHDTKLFQYLQSVNQEYADRITKFVHGIAPLMAEIKNYFPYYTRHDAHHGYQVVGRMAECVLPACFVDGTPEAFTAQEVFLLIAAAYAHDLGMTVFPGEREALAAELGITLVVGWETNVTLQKHLRANHSLRGGKYIAENAEALGVPRNLISALDNLMKAHNYPIPTLESELQRPFAAGQKVGELRQLAVVVCVADAIEFSDTRVVDGVFESLALDDSKEARVSYVENMKHVCTGDSLGVTEDGRIVVSGTFSEPDVLALAHRTFDQMEEWLLGYHDIDNRHKVPRLKVRGEPFQRNLDFSSGSFHRLGVRLNKRSVIDLIASNAVWQNHQGIALRELVQNSVEACRYRQHHSAPADKYAPRVDIIFDRERREVTVKDNGCGMSDRVVLSNLLTVGSSRSTEKSYADAAYAPIARFGIGFWSVFSISDAAVVSTAAFEEYRGKPAAAERASGFSFEVQLSDLKDYTVFTPGVRPCGTTVTLKLKPGLFIDDVYRALKGELVCSMIPLTVTFDGIQEHIGAAPPDINEQLLFGVRQPAASAHAIKVFQHRGETADAAISLGLAFRMDGSRATFLVGEGQSFLSMMGHIHMPHTAVCGFAVPVRVAPLCIDLLRVGSYAANALTPKGFEFSLDRRQLISNDAARKFVTDAQRLFHEGYRKFLEETGSYRNDAIYALEEEALLHGGNVYDVFTKDELATAREDFADLVCIKLIPVSLDVPFATAEANARILNLKELSQIKGTVMCWQATRSSTQFGAPHIGLENSQALEVAYAVAQKASEISPGRQIYVVPPNRTFSMLFDNEQSSTVLAIPLKGALEACILSVNLESVNFEEPATEVVSDIQGVWAGGMYWRDFETRNRKPYLFLGRHRVLVKRGSKLQAHLKALADEGRIIALADTINLLREDEAGHKPPSLAHLL